MYEHFLTSPTAKQWKRLGIKRRAGVIAPLFSVYSKNSIGIGEIPDIALLADWVKACGMSLVQLLPMNDTGFKFTPYDSESGFALDPMYLSLDRLEGVELKPFRKEIDALRKKFPVKPPRVDYSFKKEKLELLEKIFKAVTLSQQKAFKLFQDKNKYWLPGYAEFKVLKEKNGLRSWEEWSVQKCAAADKPRIVFHQWLQWQLFAQFRQAKADALKKGVYLIGDLPFLSSRDSADVWSHQDCFKLDAVAGAPPDPYAALGQRWGMPPYDWDAIERSGYRFVSEKLKYAENFYDAFRIDHFVGLFRLWTIRMDEPHENHGLNGSFDPPDESVWETHGQKIVDAMLKSSKMLPLAEDLGVVPDCSYRVLSDYAICGMEIERWAKHWKAEGQPYKEPREYRENSVASVSTHDMTPFAAWWRTEADAAERERFWRFAGLKGDAKERVTPSLAERALKRAAESSSIFSIQVWQDLLGSDVRLNTPGTMNEKNWSAVMPEPLEALPKLKANKMIKAIHKGTGRV